VRKLSPSDRNRSFAGDDRVLAPYAVDAAAALCRRRRLPGVFPRRLEKRLTRTGARSRCR
jgi:hypothetical protein